MDHSHPFAHLLGLGHFARVDCESKAILEEAFESERVEKKEKNDFQ